MADALGVRTRHPHLFVERIWFAGIGTYGAAARTPQCRGVFSRLLAIPACFTHVALQLQISADDHVQVLRWMVVG